MADADPVQREARHLLEDVGLVSFPDLRIIELSGDDTRSWLNGQLTNDVRNTEAGGTVYGLFVTVKGKIMADAWVCDRGESRFYLIVPGSSVERLLSSFDGQIIMEDVEPAVRDDLAVCSLSGPLAETLSARAAEIGEVFPIDRLGRGGFDIVVERDALDAKTAALAELARSAGGDVVTVEAFEQARVSVGRPRFGVDFDDRNYPQETGLDARAVSFDKGCYLGQEVICMLENRGKLTKRLVRLDVAGDVAGSAPISESGAEVGRVTTVGRDADKTIAFGYVKNALAIAGTELDIGGVRATVVAPLGD